MSMPHDRNRSEYHPLTEGIGPKYLGFNAERSMRTILKPVVLGLGLVAGLAFGVHAQTAAVTPTPGPSVASLPMEGPRTNSATAIPGTPHVAVTPSSNYPGPAPGAGTGQMPPHFEKSADWDKNTALHPYTSSGMGPKPN
jgi:hypothetical protein